MSRLLDDAATLDAKRRDDLIANDRALGIGWQSTHRPFLVRIKDGSRVVLEFGCLAEDSTSAAAHFELLAGPGEYVSVAPVDQPPFPVLAARHQVACVDPAEVADRARKAGAL